MYKPQPPCVSRCFRTYISSVMQSIQGSDSLLANQDVQMFCVYVEISATRFHLDTDPFGGLCCCSLFIQLRHCHSGKS